MRQVHSGASKVRARCPLEAAEWRIRCFGESHARTRAKRTLTLGTTRARRHHGLVAARDGPDDALMLIDAAEI